MFDNIVKKVNPNNINSLRAGQIILKARVHDLDETFQFDIVKLTKPHDR